MFDGNGNWTSDFSAQADRDNGIKILASRFDNIFIADIKESFENCLTKDGQIAPIGNFNMGGQKITNLNNGVNDNDAVNMSQFNNAVHKTGNEIITGSKTFTGNVRIPYGTLLTKSGVAISGGTLHFEQPTDTSLKGVASIDIYGNLMRFIGVNSSKNYTVPLRLDLETNTTLSAPSDAVHSVVTTTGISKSGNGFVKFGNGIIIQWGRYDHGSNSAGFKATITLPTPFSNTNYSFSLVGTRQNDDNMTAAVNVEGRAKATTYINFQCSRVSGTSAGIRYIDWLAIGY